MRDVNVPSLIIEERPLVEGDLSERYERDVIRLGDGFHPRSEHGDHRNRENDPMIEYACTFVGDRGRTRTEIHRVRRDTIGEDDNGDVIVTRVEAFGAVGYIQHSNSFCGWGVSGVRTCTRDYFGEFAEKIIICPIRDFTKWGTLYEYTFHLTIPSVGLRVKKNMTI